MRVGWGDREANAERRANEWYDSRFPELRTKLNLHGRKGWPDQCYWVPGGRPLLIEFKKPGELPRKLQAHIHKKLRDNGYDIEVHDTAEGAIAAIKARIAAGNASGGRRGAGEGVEAGGVHAEGDEVPAGARRRRTVR